MNDMIKTLKYLLLLIPLLAVSCREEGEEVLFEEEEPVNLTISLKVPRIELTRGVSDDPRNENSTWTLEQKLADGRELYHVTLFLVEETTGRLVGLRDIEQGSSHISDGIETDGDADEDSYGANGFSKDGVVDIDAETGTEVTFTFLYDYPRHGTCEKLRRGKFRLLVVGNHTERERGSYAGLTYGDTSLEALVEEIKNDFDVTNGEGVDDFFNSYSAFFDFKVQTGTDCLCSKTNPQPLTLVQDIALNPGENYVEAELKRTYARIRLEVMNNSSSVSLTVNSLSFSDNFAQEETYLFDDPDQPDRKYTGFDKDELDFDGTDAMTPFGRTVIDKSSSQVVFDAYILESRADADDGYYYTLDVKYEGKKYELPSKIASDESSVQEIKSKVVSNIANVEAYFLIKNTSSGKYLYNNNNWLYQGVSTTEGDFDDDFLWALVRRSDESFYLYNKGTEKYVGVSKDGKTPMIDDPKNVYYEVVEDGGALYIQANGDRNLCLNNWAGAGTHLGGYAKDNGGKHQFYLAQPGGEKDARYTTSILLKTIDPVTAQVSQVENIKRNDFIDVLVTVAFDEMNGDFKFVVVPWTAKKGDIEFN
ncbi:MAG: RICIN domain-containing protein [Bacteroidaceae bacterium]|nr:RICIN domain-containing protein [Bacteroidaceae bacterium]